MERSEKRQDKCKEAGRNQEGYGRYRRREEESTDKGVVAPSGLFCFVRLEDWNTGGEKSKMSRLSYVHVQQKEE